ncbi:MAG: hypothetical protein F6K58_03025 [Symploca sp. SIO2E9]|nr:hypothetical protein [Symploca sp. SIO2E9]
MSTARVALCHTRHNIFLVVPSVSSHPPGSPPARGEHMIFQNVASGVAAAGSSPVSACGLDSADITSVKQE